MAQPAHKPAVFLDRDNTIIADPGYIDDPDMVELLPDAAAGIRLLNEAGFIVVVVSNQSGLARGRVTEAQLAQVHERLHEVLAEQQARVDAIYFCPYLDGPEATVARFRVNSDLRKPKPGMLLQAAEELGLALGRSWCVGNSQRDVYAGQRAGCRTIWVVRDETGNDDLCQPDYMASTLLEAAEIIVSQSRGAIGFATADASDATGGEAPVQRVQPIGAGGPDGPVSVLREILTFLKRSERDRRQEDFSVARLVGTLTQMLAIVAGVWGLSAVFNAPAAAGVRLLTAVFLQLAALTAFMISRR